jgi:hypothetical protein
MLGLFARNKLSNLSWKYFPIILWQKFVGQGVWVN